jgi:hypothetical protein
LSYFIDETFRGAHISSLFLATIEMDLRGHKNREIFRRAVEEVFL